MPPRPPDDPVYAVLARLTEAVHALGLSGQIRQQQVSDITAALSRVEGELRRIGEAHAAHARTVTDLQESLRRREDADAKALAELRAVKAEGSATLAGLLRHPVVIPLLTALLTAAGMWYGVRPPAPTPTPAPAHTAAPETTP